MKIKLLSLFALVCVASTTNAQVLLSENFDNLTVGALSNDTTGATPGQGGWHVQISNGTVMVVSEPNKGNIVATGSDKLTNYMSGGQLEYKDIDVLWNNRTMGNNVLKLEYDFYISDVFPDMIMTGSGLTFKNTTTRLSLITHSHDGVPKSHYSATTNGIVLVGIPDPTKSILLGNDSVYPNVYNNFPYETWVSFELFLDYNTNMAYVYIPSLGIIKSDAFTVYDVPSTLFLNGTVKNNDFKKGVKYDNIKLTALQTLPKYLNVNNFISSKFNLYPNPATNYITITNQENINIEEISFYDSNGKFIQSLNNSTNGEISINIENFASGTYLVYIKTAEGTAVKKLLKNN